jgi:hypothetical protein
MNLFDNCDVRRDSVKSQMLRSFSCPFTAVNAGDEQNANSMRSRGAASNAYLGRPHVHGLHISSPALIIASERAPDTHGNHLAPCCFRPPAHRERTVGFRSTGLLKSRLRVGAQM